MNVANRYRSDPQGLAALVQPDQVHRDTYINTEVFDLEMERLWRRAWVYVGHESQVPKPGDYLTADIAGQPVLLVRQRDTSVRVLLNRCAHKGAKLVTAPTGSTGSQFRCPYHAWIYKLDGSLGGVPLRSGYEDTQFAQSQAAGGMCRVEHIASHRGFVFARLSATGLSFEEYFGDSLSSIDNMADRSPEGELEVVGGCLRYEHNCNWKMFIENLNDTMHPMVAHESSAGTAKTLWKDEPAEKPKPMAVEVMLPFTENYQFSDAMGVRVFANGHSYTGTASVSLHANYSDVSGYEEQLRAAYGDERAHQILGTVRHNTVYYPSLTVKGAIQAIRVIRPIAADKTVIESWTLRLKGAPDELLQRTMMYSRIINSPMSVVGHDDLHCYRSIQEGLAVDPNPWVSLHRNYKSDEHVPRDQTVNGTSEISMRNQFRAWKSMMGETNE
ncbi:aromatic ring-hydroxylating dioxygenase subunit alpha [Variovorax sp. GB1P17]|uniref:aromatic ring-hydroxylating dioxygenase subunit alpha n=1 Tax=Variovorax sp. GB1P17 TaxID=3443740 RepID=UPI003F46E3F3